MSVACQATRPLNAWDGRTPLIAWERNAQRHVAIVLVQIYSSVDDLVPQARAPATDREHWAEALMKLVHDQAAAP
eukprot:95198-Chlamydomonas_euryale.AAC.1